MKVFQLSLSRWLRGVGNSKLRDPDTGKMCCVGQFLHQAGVPLETLDNKHLARELFSVMPEETRPEALHGIYLRSHHRLAICQAYAINDREDTTDETKIDRLRPIFVELGYTLEVVP